MEEENSSGNTAKISFKDAFTHPNFKGATWMGFMISFFQQYSGINCLNLYSFPIYEQSGAIDPKLGSFLFQLTGFVATFSCVILMGLYGRKTLLMLG